MDHRQPPPSHHAGYHHLPPAQAHYPPGPSQQQPTQIPIQPAQRPEHRRGPWSQQEDALLMDLVKGMDKVENWVKISEQIRTRSAKQCRERYHQNLKPSLSHQPISREEGELIMQLVNELGPKWAEIARRLHNRSDNAVKNWYNGSKNRARRHAQAAAKRAEHRAHHQHMSAHDLHHQQQLQYAQQQQHSGSASYSHSQSHHSNYEYHHQSSPSYEYSPHHHHHSASEGHYQREGQSTQYYAPTAQRNYPIPPPISTAPQSPRTHPRHSAIYETPLPSPNSSTGYHSSASSPPEYRHYTCTPRPRTSGSSGSSDSHSYYQYNYPQSASVPPTGHHDAPRESGSWLQTPKTEERCVLPPIRPRSSVGTAYENRLPTPSSPASEESLKSEAPKPTTLQKEITTKMSVNSILC